MSGTTRIYNVPTAPRALDTLISFVTSRCNSLCRTCFYWEELNRKDDLSVEEVTKLSSTMPRFNEIWLSGGEPTLREELVPIVETFYRTNGIRSINFPANRLLPRRLRDTVEDLFRECPEIG